MSAHVDAHRPSFLLRAFPPPRFLTMPAVGIDISDTTIKYVYLTRTGERAALREYGKVELPVGTIEQGHVKDPNALTQVMRKLRSEHGFEYAHLALPEEHAYLFQVDMPAASAHEVQQMLEFHLKENVPLAAEEALFDYSVYRETKTSIGLNVSVYPATIAAPYLDAFEQAKLTPLTLEIEGQATARALLSPSDTNSVIIINIGRSAASLSIASGGHVSFTASLDMGGDLLTRAISRHLDVSFHEAEKLKVEQGFMDTPENKLVYEALLPLLRDLKSSISKHYAYWQMHNESAGTDSEVRRVILVGGNANLKGLPEYLESGLEAPIDVANVWSNIMSLDETLPPLMREQSLEYATAVGLALASLGRERYDYA